MRTETTKRLAWLGCLALITCALAQGQEKFALVIGNGAYTGEGLTRLDNPVNDAQDMEAALKGLGFTVETVLNGSLGFRVVRSAQ